MRRLFAIALVCSLSISFVAPSHAANKVKNWRGKTCTIIGTKKSDVIKGTKKADVICGLGGNDIITGAGGDDVIDGGSGRDTIRGGSGADTLFGGTGDDAIYGDGGKDKLLGDANNDLLTGGTDDDVYDGGTGSNTCDIQNQEVKDPSCTYVTQLGHLLHRFSGQVSDAPFSLTGCWFALYESIPQISRTGSWAIFQDRPIAIGQIDANGEFEFDAPYGNYHYVGGANLYMLNKYRTSNTCSDKSLDRPFEGLFRFDANSSSLNVVLPQIVQVDISVVDDLAQSVPRATLEWQTAEVAQSTINGVTNAAFIHPYLYLPNKVKTDLAGKISLPMYLGQKLQVRAKVYVSGILITTQWVQIDSQSALSYTLRFSS